MPWFRVNPFDEDPSRLLAEEGQWTEPWGSSDDGAPCDKCDGSGRTAYECWSCLLTGALESCPVCSGRVRWRTAARCVAAAVGWRPGRVMG